jgi:hypothetical protein
MMTAWPAGKNRMTKRNVNTKKDNNAWIDRIRFLFCCLFFLVCFLPLFGTLAGIETPNLEKRTLASRPPLFADQTLNRDFTSQFDAYFSDQFTFRTYLISGWHQVNHLLLQQSGNERVIVGKDGWLFFRDTLDDYLGVNRLDGVALSRLDRLLHLQQSWLARRGIAWIFVVAPNKHSVYPQMMPDHLRPIHAAGNLDLLKPALADNHYLDLESLLAAAAVLSDKPIYHSTDSHWNNYGARIAAQAILAAGGQSVPGLKLETPADAPYRLVRDWTGDLAVMMNPSGPDPDWQFRYDTKTSYRYDKAIRSMEDIWIGTHNSTGHGTLLMFRDSFANALIPLLSESFARAVYSRAVPLDFSLVESEQPDLVVLEIVERNLTQLLEKPPRLPQDALPENAQLLAEIRSGLSDQPLSLSADDISLQATTSGLWLKISGLWPDGILQQSVDQVLVGLPEFTGTTISENKFTADASDRSASDPPDLVYYEACPIADVNVLDWQRNGGFTIYLDLGPWLPGPRPLRLFLHAGDHWLQADLAVTLP